MEYSQFFFTLFCMVAFCLGLNQVLSKDNILYFLRKPFEDLYETIENKTKLLKFITDLDQLSEAEAYIFKQKLKYYISKPLVLCITCFASIWGGSVFIALNGLNQNLLPFLIISCVSTAYIQTAIYVKINI